MPPLTVTILSNVVGLCRVIVAPSRTAASNGSATVCEAPNVRARYLPASVTGSVIPLPISDRPAEKLPNARCTNPVVAARWLASINAAV
ncbi:hypothetical protein D3C80_1699620 [compost metagenome]